jgi:hypothetical protein
MDIRLVGDEDLLKALQMADYKTQHKVLKKIVKDTANKTLVKPLRQATPKKTGALRGSMGAVSGKSRKNAVAFAGPRMGGKHKGYIANILEHSKEQTRYPENGQFLKTPWGPRRSVGPMKRNKFVEPTLTRHLKDAENYFIKSVRTIWEREFKRARKRGLV